VLSYAFFGTTEVVPFHNALLGSVERFAEVEEEQPRIFRLCFAALKMTVALRWRFWWWLVGWEFQEQKQILRSAYPNGRFAPAGAPGALRSG